MAATYITDTDSAGVDQTDITSITLSIASSGSNRYMAVISGRWDASSTDSAISSISFNGVSTGWTQRHDELGPGASINRASLWDKTAPDATTANCVITFAGTVSEAGATVISFSDVDQTTPQSGGTTAEGTTTTLSLTTSGATSDDIVIYGGYAAGDGYTGTAPGADQTEMADSLIVDGGTYQIRHFCDRQPGSAGNAMTGTMTSATTAEWVAAGTVVKGAAAGGASSPNFITMLGVGA